MAMLSRVRVQAAMRLNDNIVSIRHSSIRAFTVHKGPGRRRQLQATSSAMCHELKRRIPILPVSVCGHFPYHRTRNLSTAAQEQESMEHIRALTRTAVRKMRLSQLREELRYRGMSDDGRREELMKRLQASLIGANDGAEADIPLEETQQRANIDLKVSTSTKQKEDHKNVLVEDPLLDEGDVFDEDTRIVVGHSLIEDGEVEESSIDDTKSTIPTIDPDLTYIIRVNSAHSGLTRVVEGSGIGFTLLQVDGNTGQQSVIQTNHVLLPGPRTPFEADYSALVMAMRHAKNIGIRHLVMVSNDLGIVRQVNGEGGIRDNGYQRELHQKVKDLETSFDSFAIRHRSDSIRPEDHEHEPAHHEVNNNILAKTALARQRNLESEWKDMVDPITDRPAATYLNRYSIQPDKEYLLQFDGGARGNPSGIAGAGMVIFDNEDEVWCGWNYLGDKITNNMAEYESLIAGLECAEKLGIRKLRAEGDSELIVKQVNGLYQVKKEWLRPLHARVKQLMSKFDKCSITSIPRADNKRADFLANHAMDTGTCNSANQL